MNQAGCPQRRVSRLAPLAPRPAGDAARTSTAAIGAALTWRRILVDLVEEYARHAGHADLLRESVDGLVGEDPPD